MRTSNPSLNGNTFSQVKTAESSEVMTIQGAVNKSFILILCAGLTASFVWIQYFNSFNGGMALPLMIGGVIGGLIFALITVFKKTWSPVTAPMYALFEGLFLGGISAYMEAMYPGIVINAMALTIGTFLCLLMTYKSGFIKATENFKLGIVAATGAIGLIYLASFILGFFGTTIPYIHESGWIGIGFSLFVVVIAAMNLVLDFDFIEEGSAKGAPKYMEWYAAFALLVTLVWLYIEILKLLAKLRRR